MGRRLPPNLGWCSFGTFGNDVPGLQWFQELDTFWTPRKGKKNWTSTKKIRDLYEKNQRPQQNGSATLRKKTSVFSKSSGARTELHQCKNVSNFSLFYTCENLPKSDPQLHEARCRDLLGGFEKFLHQSTQNCELSTVSTLPGSENNPQIFFSWQSGKNL